MKKSFQHKYVRRIKSNINKNNKLLLPGVIVLVLVVFGLFVIYSSFAATTVAMIRGENLIGSGQILKYNSRSKNGYLKLTNGTPATGQLNLSAKSDTIQVRARGSKCQGSPQVLIQIDGKVAMIANVLSRAWQNYSAKFSIGPGSHKVSAILANPLTSGCQRYLDIDLISFISTQDNTALDRTPPVIKITSPKDNTTVSGNVQIDANITDNKQVEKAELYIDDVLTSTITASPYSFDWDTAYVLDGQHKLSVVAYDKSGNKAQSQISLKVVRTKTGAQLPINYDINSIMTPKYFVASNGSDANTGNDINKPFATLSKAVSVASNGDTIVIRGGTYYDQGEIVLNKSLKIAAYPGEIPVFEGSRNLASGWVNEASYKYYPGYSQMPLLGCCGFSNSNLTGNGVGRFSDQLWVANSQLRQVVNKSELVDGSFWVDSSNGRLYLTSNDSNKGSIYASKLKYFVVVNNPNTSIEGLVLNKYSNSTSGVITVNPNADSFLAKDIEVNESSFIAMIINGNSKINSNSLLKNVTIGRSNWMGINSGYTDNLTLESVDISGLNQFDEFTVSPQSGALKAVKTRGAKVLNSNVSNNKSHGIWFDQSNVGTVISGNVMLYNSGSAVFYEISDDLLLINNYILSNSTTSAAVKTPGSSGLKIINNTIIGGSNALGVYTDSRSIPGCSAGPVPGCPSVGSDRDGVRQLPSTLDWMPRVDIMINNIIAYPTAGGLCSGTRAGLCFTTKNATATTNIQSIIHPADPARGIPQTLMNSNVYANSIGSVIAVDGKGFTDTNGFSSFMALYPVQISNIETNGLSGNQYVNPDGSPTANLSALQNSAVAIPSNTLINSYLPAGLQHFGVIYK